jgi:hypothetical protein
MPVCTSRIATESTCRFPRRHDGGWFFRIPGVGRVTVGVGLRTAKGGKSFVVQGGR